MTGTSLSESKHYPSEGLDRLSWPEEELRARHKGHGGNVMMAHLWFAELMPARVQGGPRRRTGRADAEVSEPHGLVMEAVQVRGLEDGVAQEGGITITMVIA